jgi:hypothetical protein
VLPTLRSSQHPVPQACSCSRVNTSLGARFPTACTSRRRRPWPSCPRTCQWRWRPTPRSPLALFLEPAATRGRTPRRGRGLVRRTALDECDIGPRHAGLTEEGGSRQSARQFLPFLVAAGGRG